MADSREDSYFYSGLRCFLANFTIFRSLLAEVLHCRGNFCRHAPSLLERALQKLEICGRWQIYFFICLMESTPDRDMESEIKIVYGCLFTAF